MGKIVLLVPREEMLYLAHNILQEKKYAIAQMRVIQTENTAVSYTHLTLPTNSRV